MDVRGRGRAEQVARLAVDFESYRTLAEMPHWHGLAKRTAYNVAAAGLAKFADVEPLKTDFVQWEVGGTYRHRCRLHFDRPIVVPEHHGGHHRPGIIGDLFGRGSSSKSGVLQVAPQVLEVYQDQ